MFERRERQRAHDQASQIWDAYVRGQDTSQSTDVAEAIRQLHQRARTPEPSPDFAANLEATLMQTATDLAHWPPSSRRISGLDALPWNLPAPRGRQPDAGAGQRSMRVLAAAALLIAMFASLIAGSQVWRVLRTSNPPTQLPSLEAVLVATPNAITTPQKSAGIADQLWETPVGEGQALTTPTGVNLDPQGRIWVVDGAEDRLQAFSVNGDLLETRGEPGTSAGQFDFAGRGDIAYAPDGTYYVADTGNHRVQQFAPDGAFVQEWDSAGNAGGELASPATAAMLARPNDVAIAPDGTVYVSDGERNVVEHYSSDGVWLNTLGIAGGQDRLNAPAGVAFDANGNVWVADYGRGRLAVFAPDGTYLQDVGPVSLPTDLVFDGAGQLYLADAKGLLMLDANFNPLGRFWRDEGMFAFLPSVALGPDGRVYSAENNLGFLTAFELRDPLPAPPADSKPLRVTPATP